MLSPLALAVSTALWHMSQGQNSAYRACSSHLIRTLNSPYIASLKGVVTMAHVSKYFKSLPRFGTPLLLIATPVTYDLLHAQQSICSMLQLRDLKDPMNHKLAATS